MAASRRTSLLFFLALFAGFLSPVLAQTFTDCDPLKRTDCPANPALGQEYTFNFTGKVNDVIWNATSGQVNMGKKGGEFTIREKLQSPTIKSRFFIFFGRLEVHMKAATGKGIVSSIVLQSEDRDEIDWEWVGNDQKNVQTNYFGKGDDKNVGRGKKHEVENPMKGMHNYTIDWTKERIEWWVDEKKIRTLKYDDAQGGDRFPQTPATVRMGIWPAGDPDENKKGTIEWAGGEVDYAEGPYSMIVESMKVEDYSSGKEYVYGDKTGDWKSIKINKGQSKVAKEVAKGPRKSLNQKFNELPAGAKVGIFGGAAGLLGLIVATIVFCCIKQRRVGRREFNVEDSQFVSTQNNNLALRNQYNQTHAYRNVA